jgi:hypothetical protein
MPDVLVVDGCPPVWGRCGQACPPEELVQPGYGEAGDLAKLTARAVPAAPGPT